MATIRGTTFNDNDTWQWTYFSAWNMYLNVFYYSLKGTNLSDDIQGLSGNDILYGYGGNDWLDGGTGTDTMYGGLQDDGYKIDSTLDRIIENVGEGVDHVVSSVSTSYKWLPNNVENLHLIDNAYYGDGNDINNKIYGTNTANSLYGYGGNDYLYGSGGNDYLYGGNGNDKISGGSGYDTLYGDSGFDRFEFLEWRADGRDIIYNFSAVEDSIGLDTGLSGGTGPFAEGLAFTGSSEGSQLRNEWYFEGSGFNGNGYELSGIYVDTNNGSIWYNATSGVPGDSYNFAIVDRATIVGGVASLSAADFVSVHYFDIG